MNNFPFNPSNPQNFPTFNTYEEYQEFMQYLQNNPPLPQQFFSPNFTNSQIPNTQQYDAPTPNQGSSNRDNWVTAEDDTDDDEEADAAEPILTPSVLSNTLEKNPASSKASKRSWSHREEEALIACYMMHCTDQSMSTNQTKPEVWRKVYESYQAARESRPRELPERNLNMMQLHWKRMCTDIMKWVGCFEESKRVNRSGEKDKNILEYAKTIYHHQEGKKFSYQYAWETLCEYPKWKTKVERWTNCYGKGKNIAGDSGKKSDSSGKRIRVDDDDVDDEEGVSNKSVRPDGVKKAKAKAVQQRKGKGVSSTSGDGSLSLDEKLQIYAELKGNEVSLKREKLELEKEMERRRKEEMKHSLLQTLLSKPPPLTPKEEKMKDKLWAELYGEFSD